MPKRALTLATWVLATVALALVPRFTPLSAQEVLVNVASFALLAVGLNVVVGLAGLLDLGYIAFFATGTYMWAIFSGAGPIKFAFAATPFWGEWGFWLILLVTIAVNMLIGVLLGSPTLRLRGDYLAIVTLGFGEIVRIVANNADPITRGAQGIQGVPHPKVTHLLFVALDKLPFVSICDEGTLCTDGFDFGLRPGNYYYLLVILVVLVIIAIYRLEDSRVGRAWIAIREDEVAAEAMGVPTLKMKLLAFAIGASTAGLAGVVMASKTNYISPGNFDVLTSILVLCAVVLGGMGSMKGSLLGAGVIVGLPGFAQLFVQELDQYRFWFFGLLLVVMMIFRPQGLLPSKRREAELRPESPQDAPVTEAVPSARSGTEEPG